VDVVVRDCSKAVREILRCRSAAIKKLRPSEFTKHDSFTICRRKMYHVQELPINVGVASFACPAVVFPCF
jgi:hypothetical protein